MVHLFRIFLAVLLTLCSCNSFGFTSINFQEAVEIGGIKQWISLKGSNKHNPVLLFLHGGPGNSAMGYADKFTSVLQQHFVVVQWDQRESGKTASLNHSDKPLTVALMTDDAIEIINYLRSRFGQKKIYLMGHSWGGFLGLMVAAAHPEVLEAYFAISPMVNQLESERLSLASMQTKAKDRGDQGAMAELAMVAIPFQNGDQLYYHRKWLAREMRSTAPQKRFVEAWAKKWLDLFNEASAVNLSAIERAINCPVFFFVGSRDYQTNFKITEEYYKMLKAEKKDLFWFTNSAHSLNLTEPKKLQEIIISLQSNN